MHEHQTPLVTIIDLFIGWFSDAFSFDLFPSFSQVVVPQLVAVSRVTFFVLSFTRGKFWLHKNHIKVHLHNVT